MIMIMMMIMDDTFTLPPIQVCTKEEQEILQRDSNKSLKLRKKLMGGVKTTALSIN